MWSLFSKPKKQLDLEKTYIRIQFLTPQQKSKKRQIIKKMKKQYQNDEESIVPYQGSFMYSFKFILNTLTITGGEPIKNKMIINEMMCHLQITTNQQLAQFMNTYVKEIQLFIHNEEMKQRNDVVQLYSEVQTSQYKPEEVLEIIYQPRTLWERIKNRAKKIVKNVPATIFSITKKILGFFLGSFGFGGGITSIIWKMMPTNSLVQWIISILSLFFPMMGPLLNIGSKMIL